MGTDDDVLSFEDIAAIEDRETIFVPVPRWGDRKVGIRMLSAKERAQLEKAAGGKGTDPVAFRKRLLMATLCNKDGSPLLATEGHADVLMGKSAAACEFLIDKALEHNRVTQKDVEDLEKN